MQRTWPTRSPNSTSPSARNRSSPVRPPESKLQQQIAALPAGSSERVALERVVQRLGAAAGGRGRRGEHHRAGRLAAHPPSGTGLEHDGRDRPADRAGDRFRDRLPARVARPTGEVDRGVRARVPAAGARRDPRSRPSAHAARHETRGSARALPHPAQRPRLRCGHPRARHAAGDQRNRPARARRRSPSISPTRSR